MKTRLLPVLLLALAAPAAAETDAEVVSRLGAEEWKDREAAMRACLDRPGARALLEDAAASEDPEVRWRARWALDCLDWGIDSALLGELGNPFDRWRTMDTAELGTALEKVLAARKGARAGVLLRGLRRVEDEALRQRLMAGLRAKEDGAEAWAKERLASEDPETRVGAALALALWGDKSGAEALKTDLESGKPLFGRSETIEALVAIGESAGLKAVLAAIRDAVKAKKVPGTREIEAIAAAPLGTGDVEQVLLEVLEAEWPAGADVAAVNDAALKALARCAGPGAVARLAAWWEKEPERRAEAITVAVAIADQPAREELAGRVAARLGGEKATPDDLFLVAAVSRIAGRKEEHRKAVDRMAAAEASPAGFERIAEVVITLLEAGDAKGAEAYAKKVIDRASDSFGPLGLLWREALEAAGKDGGTFNLDPDMNNESWELVTHPERLAHPGLAVRLSEWTLKNNPGALPQRGTLGAAYYRAGRFEEAVKTLEQNVDAPYDGKQEDIAFLAMAYVRLGRMADAERTDARCREWEASDTKPNPLRPELERVLRAGRQTK